MSISIIQIAAKIETDDILPDVDIRQTKLLPICFQIKIECKPKKQKPLKIRRLSGACLGAGVGFEPTTFRL